MSVIKRDGRCMWCGRIDDTLVGHHLDSWGSSGNDDESNVITLCGRCHTQVGQGYLDISACNHPAILVEVTTKAFKGASVSKHDRKLFDPNSYLKRILEEALSEE